MIVGLLAAAGRSERFGADKLRREVGGAPVWLKSYRALAGHPEIDSVVIVCSAGHEEEMRRHAPEAIVVPGGASRQESVQRGLDALPSEAEIVLIHDAARPWVTEEVISRVIAGVRERGAAYPGIPVSDTIRQTDGTTLDRSQLLAVQTPQGFRVELIRQAHAAGEPGATDDIKLVEAMGVSALAVEGDPANTKITHPTDLPMIEPREYRTGLGYDVHRFSEDPDRPLWLGGIEFDDKPGLEGHSDADALLHAVVDSLLGAAGLGDIGEHYPNTDPRWKDAPSSLFLRETANRLRAEGWTIEHIDVAVLAERPKILPRRAEMIAHISAAIDVRINKVSIKATTNEGLGAIGRGEGIAAFATATLSRPLT